MELYDKDKFKDYAKQRSDLMSEEEIRQYDIFVDWYRSSWNDKDQRGLFDKWQLVDDYWEGDINLPVNDGDPGSNTNIVLSNTEGEVSLLVEQNIAVTVAPRGPSDRPYSEAVRIMLTWVNEQNRLKRKMDVHERRRKNFGTGIWRVLFDSKYMNGFGLPRIEPVNPAYVYVDPNITDVYKIQDGEFLIEAVNKSIAWAEKEFGKDIARAIIPGFNAISGDLELFGEDEGETDTKSMDNFVLLYIWTHNKDGELKLIQESGCGIKCRDSEDEGVKFPNDLYPYFFTPMYFREGTIWGKGDTELLIPTQDLINDLDDQIRINARLTGNPPKLVSTLSGIDLNKFTNEPGLNVPCHDINTAARYLEAPGMPNYIIDRRKYALEYELQKVSRFSDQQAGIAQKGVDTATEAMALQQASSSGIAHKKLLLEETFCEVENYVLDLIKENYTEEQAFRITEMKTDPLWFRGSDLKTVPRIIRATQEYTKGHKGRDRKYPNEMILMKEDKSGPETKEAEFDITVTIGAGMPSNKAFQYKMVSESFTQGVITAPEYRKWLVENMGLPFSAEMPAPPVQPVVPGQTAPGGQPGATPSPNIQGMTANNKPNNPAGGIPA